MDCIVSLTLGVEEAEEASVDAAGDELLRVDVADGGVIGTDPASTVAGEDVEETNGAGLSI